MCELDLSRFPGLPLFNFQQKKQGNGSNGRCSFKRSLYAHQQAIYMSITRDNSVTISATFTIFGINMRKCAVNRISATHQTCNSLHHATHVYLRDIKVHTLTRISFSPILSVLFSETETNIIDRAETNINIDIQVPLFAVTVRRTVLYQGLLADAHLTHTAYSTQSVIYNTTAEFVSYVNYLCKYHSDPT
jgi:hypothetical protein